MATQGHETELINVQDLKAALQKLKTDKIDAHTQDTSNPHNVTKSQVGLSNVENKSSSDIRGELTSSNVTSALGYTPINQNEKGANSGVATLDNAGKVPSSQLPSYVDDVLEYATMSAFPATGESGKIYVDLSTDRTYRWSGTQYTPIKGDLAIGSTTGTAADGGVVNTHTTDSTIHVTSTEKQMWNNKQDGINDLETIRSGASKGATAYQLPNGGIPSNDINLQTLANYFPYCNVNIFNFADTQNNENYVIINELGLGGGNTYYPIEHYYLYNGQEELLGEIIHTGNIDDYVPDISGKANKSEMSVTDGTGADSDKTTIQLKSGTSATVLKSHQDISGKLDVIRRGEISLPGRNGSVIHLFDEEGNELGVIESNQTESGIAIYNYTSNKQFIVKDNGDLTYGKPGSYENLFTEVTLIAMSSTAPATCVKWDKYYNTTSKKIFTATAANTWGSTGVDPEGGKIYIADNKAYRWNGTDMSQLDTTVTSVAGKTGAVTLNKSDVGLGNVDNTSDAAKDVLSAKKLMPIADIEDYGAGMTVGDLKNYIFYNDDYFSGLPNGSYVIVSDDFIHNFDDDSHTVQLSGEPAIITFIGGDTAMYPLWLVTISASIVENIGVIEGGGTGGVGLRWLAHTDDIPNVPSWALQSSKPTYTASEVGLGNVGNFKAVSTVANQGLTDTEKSNARTNLGLGSMATKSSLAENDIPSIHKSKISDFPTSMPARNQIASYTPISSNTSGVTTSLTEDGSETKVYYNSGSAAVTVSFATSGLVFTDGNDSMEIPAGGYGEVNFLRVTTDNTTRVFVRSIVSE